MFFNRWRDNFSILMAQSHFPHLKSIMIKLNLPDFDLRMKQEDDAIWIWDLLRKKYVVLTPEEWVRQHFVHYIINELKYPSGLIKLESGLTYNKLQKRSDIVVHDRSGNPWMVIECKSAEQSINQEVLHQASVYNQTLKAPYLTVTNGLISLFFAIDWKTETTVYLVAPPIFEK